jgi:hypothetical protein
MTFQRFADNSGHLTGVSVGLTLFAFLSLNLYWSLHFNLPKDLRCALA